MWLCTTPNPTREENPNAERNAFGDCAPGKLELDVEKAAAAGGRFSFCESVVATRSRCRSCVSSIGVKAKSMLSFRSYSNRVPAAVAQPAPIRLSLASKTSIAEWVVNSSPLAPSSRVAVIFCDPIKTPLAL